MTGLTESPYDERDSMPYTIQMDDQLENGQPETNFKKNKKRGCGEMQSVVMYYLREN